jgi:hypothetical protein
VFCLVAGALAVSLNMVGCVVCLFEVASRAFGDARAAECYIPETVRTDHRRVVRRTVRRIEPS